MILDFLFGNFGRKLDKLIVIGEKIMAKQADVDAALDALNAKVVAGFDSLNSSLQAEFTAIIAEIRKLELATSEDLQPLVDKVNQTGVNIDAAIANIKTALDKESGDLGSGALD